MSMSTNQSTLVIKLGALGDMVQAVPMFDVLRQQYGCNLTLLTTAPFLEFAQRSGYFKTVLCDERGSLKRNLAVLSKLRKHYFARIIDLQNVDRTRLYRLLLAGRFGEWITDPYRQSGAHPYRRFSALCSAQGWPALPQINIEMMAGQFDVISKNPYALIVAGASNAHGGKKRWSQSAYGALCERLIDRGVTPVLIGSNADNLHDLQELCEDMAIINLIGKTTLFQLITIAKGAVGAIGNDTGPQLIIAASGCPTITLFSSVNPPSKGGAWPWNEAQHKNVYADDLANLSVDTVWDVAQQLFL